MGEDMDEVQARALKKFETLRNNSSNERT